ncbi:MAG: hypothetical protein HOP33_12160 [Verrucomicrobia bacterium]|nr:hypothetical protein [Verrucomicrobiota bacterium]
MNDIEQTYSKLVVGNHSPENSCFATDNDVLLVKPRSKVPQKVVIQHHFVSAADGKTKSKFGWVKEVAAFTFTDFVTRYIGKGTLTPAESEHILTMLESIQNLAVNTPVTCNYKSRGVIEQSMQLTVHKVFFYSA